MTIYTMNTVQMIIHLRKMQKRIVSIRNNSMQISKKMKKRVLI